MFASTSIALQTTLAEHLLLIHDRLAVLSVVPAVASHAACVLNTAAKLPGEAASVAAQNEQN